MRMLVFWDYHLKNSSKSNYRQKMCFSETKISGILAMIIALLQFFDVEEGGLKTEITWSAKVESFFEFGPVYCDCAFVRT